MECRFDPGPGHASPRRRGRPPPAGARSEPLRTLPIGRADVGLSWGDFRELHAICWLSSYDCVMMGQFDFVWQR